MNLEELDRLAAEKVMGWDGIYFVGIAMKYREEMWQPTRNIAQAFELLWKLQPAYYAVQCFQTHHRCYIEMVMNQKGDEADGGDDPLAIVKAALRVKGVDL